MTVVPQQQALDSAWRVDTGRTRGNNEDAVDGFEPVDPAVRAERGCLYVVADGMGGHAAGEVASNYAVQSILHTYYSAAWAGVAGTLTGAIRRANEDIHTEGGRDAERRGMGSTVVAAAVLDNQAVIAHAGDSRAYLLRNGQLILLTRDHTWVAERLADGTLSPEEAEHHPNRNVLTRNLGSRIDVEPEVTIQPLQRGDRLLLCSDGLWGAISEVQIAALAQRTPAEHAVSALVAAANAAGGPDNIGVALIHAGGGSGTTTRRLAAFVPPPTFDSVAKGTRRLPVHAGRGPLGGLLTNKPLLAVAGMVALAGLLIGATLIASGGSKAAPPAGTATTEGLTSAAPGNSRATPPRAGTRASPTPTGPSQYAVKPGDAGLSTVWQACAADGTDFDAYLAALLPLNPTLENNAGATLQPGQVVKLPASLTKPVCGGLATPPPPPPPPAVSATAAQPATTTAPRGGSTTAATAPRGGSTTAAGGAGAPVATTRPNAPTTTSVPAASTPTAAANVGSGAAPTQRTATATPAAGGGAATATPATPATPAPPATTPAASPAASPAPPARPPSDPGGNPGAPGGGGGGGGNNPVTAPPPSTPEQPAQPTPDWPSPNPGGPGTR